jgi:hypothetical protein
MPQAACAMFEKVLRSPRGWLQGGESKRQLSGRGALIAGAAPTSALAPVEQRSSTHLIVATSLASGAHPLAFHPT